jgi:hypothetical protein
MKNAVSIEYSFYDISLFYGDAKMTFRVSSNIAVSKIDYANIFPSKYCHIHILP